MFYEFSDALIEQEVNGMSVAEIFKLHGESFFRKKEVSQQTYACMSSMYFMNYYFIDGSFRKVRHYFHKMGSITVTSLHGNIYGLSGLNFLFSLNLILGHNAFYFKFNIFWI